MGDSRPCHNLLFAGAERCSRPSEGLLKIHCERVCATEHAPRGRYQFLERRHGFAEIAKRGACVHMRCSRVIRPHPERELMIFAEDALRHGDIFAQRFCSLRPRRIIWTLRCRMRGGGGGTSVACASKITTASYGARSGGVAGRRTWVGRRRTRFGAWQ